MTKNDTLQKALIHIDKLQHQVDSLKTLNYNKLEILQSQLDQSNNTVSNLGSLSTTWGTIYAVSACVVGFLTIALAIATFGVPIWLKKKSKKAISKIDASFNEKITTMETSYKQELKKIKDEVEIELSSLKAFSEQVKVTEGILIFYTQGHAQLLSENYKLATYNFLLAGYYWFKNANISGIELALLMTATALENIDLKEYTDLNESLVKYSTLDLGFIEIYGEIQSFEHLSPKSKDTIIYIDMLLKKISE